MKATYFALAIGLALVACNDDTDTETDLPDPLVGPEMVWTDQPAEALVEATPLTVTVEAADPQGVARVVTYYRTEGERTWITAPPMEAEGDAWTVEIPVEGVAAPGLELYFKGEDADGTVSFLPEQGSRAPLSVDVRRQGLGLPYVQDFEDVPNDLLREIGWAETSLQFEGYEWGRVVNRAYSGEASIRHGRTPPNLSNDLDDWLISPVLDLTTIDKAQVSWREYGDRIDAATHALWLSTGSPDPRDGDYVKLADLSPPPEREWGRSDVVDLSAWAAEPAVYLAWTYQGIDADIWWLDDVEVRALAPDLRVAGLSVSPEPLSPGDEGTLTLTVENRTTVAASDITLVVAADDGATFGDPIVIPAIEGEGSVDVDVPMTIDGDFYENAWIDLDISATTAADDWSFSERMLVGQESTLSLTYTLEPLDELDTEQLVRIVIGVGDPTDPDLEIPLPGELLTSGTYDVELDITGYPEFLPPSPGVNRWWARVENGPFGTVDAFNIEYGGEVIPSADTGFFFGFAPELFFLPQPPEPRVTSQTTTPSPVAPGSDVSWTVNLANAGEGTQGPTTIRISTVDPAVTMTSAGPFALGTSGGWARGASASVDFGFSVASDRKNSRPIQFVAAITDAFETIEVPIDVQVPWPVITVSGLVIDDWDDGDADGLLEPSETANLDLSITNVGGLNTFGSTTCALAVTGGTATATVDVASSFIGVISAESTETEDDFQVTVTAGSNGDTLDFTLTCTDRDETYVAPFQITLGERPWVSISAIDDPVGDSRDSYRFDAVNGRYRSDGKDLQIELTSDTPHGGLTGLFIEFWGRSTGAEYVYYNGVAAGSSGNLRGYGRGFTPLTTFTVTEVDAYTLRFDVPLEPMNLRVDSMELGFGIGFCGGTTQYCDHFPDGWGAPYTGLNTSRWVTLTW